MNTKLFSYTVIEFTNHRNKTTKTNVSLKFPFPQNLKYNKFCLFVLSVELNKKKKKEKTLENTKHWSKLFMIQGTGTFGWSTVSVVLLSTLVMQQFKSIHL